MCSPGLIARLGMLVGGRVEKSGPFEHPATLLPSAPTWKIPSNVLLAIFARGLE